MKDEPKSVLAMVLGILLAFGGIIALMAYTLTGCTISFQNISTHGTATDLVDEQQDASPKVDAKLSGHL